MMNNNNSNTKICNLEILKIPKISFDFYQLAFKDRKSDRKIPLLLNDTEILLKLYRFFFNTL